MKRKMKGKNWFDLQRPFHIYNLHQIAGNTYFFSQQESERELELLLSECLSKLMPELQAGRLIRDGACRHRPFSKTKQTNTAKYITVYIKLISKINRSALIEGWANWNPPLQ